MSNLDKTEKSNPVSYWKSILYIVLGGILSAAFFGLLLGFGFERSGFTGQFLLGGLVGSLFIPWSRDNFISRYYKYFMFLILFGTFILFLSV
jgi:hypothetical protein